MSNYQKQIEDMSTNLSRLDDEIAALEKIAAHHPQLAAYTRPAISSLRRLRTATKKLRKIAIEDRQIKMFGKQE